jgi:energy-converting hydrogenase Eha subunit C
MNPIRAYEYRRMTGIITQNIAEKPRWVRLRRSSFYGTAAGGILLSGVCFWVALFDPDVFRNIFFSEYGNWRFGLAFLGAFALRWHFESLQNVLWNATQGVTRSKPHLWEAVALSPVTAWDLVMGKWRALLVVFVRSFLWLALMRIGCVLMIGVFVNGSPVRVLTQEPVPQGNIPARFLLAMGFITALTVANLLYTASAGVLASVLSGAGVLSAFLIRLVGVVVPFLGLLVITLRPYIDGFQTTPEYVLTLVQVTLMDNGTLVSSGLATPLDGDWPLYVAALSVALGVYALLTAGTLWLAAWSARHYGMA